MPDDGNGAALDLSQGVPRDRLPDGGMLPGKFDGEDLLLVETAGEVFAVSPQCTHYQGPLAEGLLVGTTLRCPWHHAAFDLQSGEALRAPAFSPLSCWRVEQRDGKIFVLGKRPRSSARAAETDGAAPANIVIIGGGGAGFAAAEMLRREGFEGSLTMLSSDDAFPYDRPSLSKDYLAGSIPFDYVPLKDDAFYAKRRIDFRRGQDVSQIDAAQRQVVLESGEKLSYDRLLLATGAEPIRLAIPGADQPQVHLLRSLQDCNAIIANAASARTAVVVGASFIGLEVAAALRQRKLDVHVVAPDKIPMERILGAEMGSYVRRLHEQHGVTFHLEDKAVAINGKTVKLASGGTIEADLVVAGIGVRPRLELAEKAGLRLDRGVVVDPYLETSAGGIYAAGDIVRWSDPHSGNHIRVEHWVVAERQGQIAAQNMLGRSIAFSAVPFFWSQHYDQRINYVGHAEGWDGIDVEGDVAKGDCVLRFKRNGRVTAVASLSRDLAGLQAELALEQAHAA